MKLRLLLLFLLLAGMLNAQDTIRTFIITEARMDRNDICYVELTNIGEDPINMSHFEFGRISPFGELPYSPAEGEYMMLPDKELAPGESFVIASFRDFSVKMHPLYPDIFGRRVTKEEMWDLADMQMHFPHPLSDKYTEHTDSVSENYQIMETWGGRDCWYIEQHFPATESTPADSLVIDQVGGVFDDEGLNFDQAYDVAGVTDATATTTLVRKANVTQGNTNFADARGIDIADSEWIPIPHLYMNGSDSYNPWRAVLWTVGNHGNYTLDETTLVSDVLDVDWTSKTITAPWGVRNNDDFMEMFEKTEGIAWHYHLSPAREDSAFNSARTGDKLTVYACGNTLQSETFDIIIEEPADNANIVIPMFAPEREYDEENNTIRSYYDATVNSGNDEVYQVTMNDTEMDTITNGLFGIPYATRTDSLMKYLEKAPNADWEFVWIDGIERTDVKFGDILKVTSESGLAKEYFIKVDVYRPEHNAYLSSITWPDIDIPDYLIGLYGWLGDTIPNFGSTVFNYKVQVPSETQGIPALVSKTEDLNATVGVKRASSLSGTPEQRTIEFTVIAEDDTTVNVYSVQLEKEKDIDDIQPFEAEPFLSEIVFQDQWNNGFIEICNPGNQPLDLSDYMMVMTYNDKEGSITDYSGVDQWGVRYRKYVPGYKWKDETEWASNPGTLEQDLNVGALVQPGDVFVIGHINGTNQSGYPWWASEQCDVIVNTEYNPWNEVYDDWASVAQDWMGTNFYIYKIVNDSVKQGRKPANDPSDFELIEVFGMGDGSNWIVGGEQVQQTTNYMRKPQYWQGKTQYTESFGTNREDSEWIWTNRTYWTEQGIGWPNDILYITLDIGKHFMHEVTGYKSTVSSIVYKVSPGYQNYQTIGGVKTGATATTFLSGIVKADEDQSLTLLAASDGSELTGDALLSNSDTLRVLSADSTNTTKYVLEVTEEGLSSDAELTSTRYVVDIDTDPQSVTEGHTAGSGSITGFEYGTQLKTILNNINVPAGAILQVIDEKGAYVPLQMLNFDTAYVDVTVNHLTYFEVTAEDGVTQIVYQLLPQVSQTMAFVTSNVYGVNQSDLIIRYVPRGTTVDAFMSNILPSLGATVKLVDKMGLERTDGQITQDDKLVVTAPNGENQTVYYLGMLATQLQPEVDYLAYVLSDVYTVDQGALIIGGAAGSTLLDDFYANITPAFGASAVVVDIYGEDKTSGDLDDGDMLKVVSADGSATVMYELALDLTTTEQLEKGEIVLYPNPTDGKVNINGLEKGTRLQVFNQVGSMIQDVTTDQNLETISLDKQPSGMYLIVVTKDAGYIGQFKVIRK